MRNFNYFGCKMRDATLVARFVVANHHKIALKFLKFISLQTIVSNHTWISYMQHSVGWLQRNKHQFWNYRSPIFSERMSCTELRHKYNDYIKNWKYPYEITIWHTHIYIYKARIWACLYSGISFFRENQNVLAATYIGHNTCAPYVILSCSRRWLWRMPSSRI
jgi:hypothetical protein